jgi:hypothetical protein
MIYLNVPFEQKDIAKSMGARWDPEKKLWFSPNESFKTLIETFGGSLSSQTAVKKTKININKKQDSPLINIKNLDLSLGQTLLVELIPKNNNLEFHSLHRNLSQNNYYQLKTTICKALGYRCQICSLDCSQLDNEDKRMYLCERWNFNSKNNFCILEKIIGVCNKCMITIRLKDKHAALKHLMEINKLSEEDAKQHISNSFVLWKKRNEIVWTLDLSLLEIMGIKWDSMDKLKEKDKECVVISNDTNSTSDIKKISIRKRNVNVGNSPICLID